MVNSIDEVGIGLPDLVVVAGEEHGRLIEIPVDIKEEMVAYAIEGLPKEACGLLAGRDARVERFYRMRNADDSPVAYRLDPKEQLQVFNEIEDEHRELLGIYHSHTHTEAYPSATDRSQAFYPEAHYVLVSLADRDSPVMRAFTIRDGEVEEQELRFL
jgi:proteasome lid subunit RPN8/RPN11